jgi:small subunit ribosomal protein S3
MGQKVRPTGFRVGIMQPWKSAWYAGKHDFSELLVEDAKIRAFIPTYLARTKDRKEQRPMISEIRIERTRERVTVVVYSSRVGAIIGKKGEKIDKLTAKLEKLTRRHIEVKTVEITRPEIDPQIVAGDRTEHGERGEGDQDSTVRPARRGRNGPVRKGHAGLDPALHPPGESRLRLHRSQHPAGEHRDQGLGEQRRLSDRGDQRCH